MTDEWDGQNGVLRRYLLGSDPESERERLEQALLMDDNLYEELLATEDELIDEYVCGGLSESERDGFVHYLSALPNHEQKLAFAEALRSRSLASPTEAARASDTAQSQQRAPSHPAVPALFMAAALLLMILGGVWSFVTISDLREEVGRSRSELARFQEREADLPRQPAANPNSGLSSRPVRTFLLAAGTLRGGGSRQVVSVPREPELLELRLDLGSVDYQTYRAVVHDANAREVMSFGGLGARNQEDRLLVVFNVSSDVFTPGDYYISLMGDADNGEPEPVSRYDFRISSE